MKCYYSPALIGENKINKQLKWGTLHNFDSSYMYGYDDSQFLRHYRDELIEDFYSVTPHESDDNTMNKKKIANHIAADFNEDERFSAFLGFLWWVKIKQKVSSSSYSARITKVHINALTTNFQKQPIYINWQTLMMF